MLKKIPFIEQMNQTECGLACIAMLSSYYKKNVPLHELRDIAGNSRDGNTLYDLYKLAQHLDFEVKCFQSESRNLKLFKQPLLLHWEGSHFVVLEKVKNNKFYIVDPSNGRSKITKKDFDQHFTGYIMTLSPNYTFEKRKENNLWKSYVKLLFEFRYSLLSLFLFTLFLQSFVLITPIITQHIIDSVKNNNDTLLFTSITLIAMILYFTFNIIKNELSILLLRKIDFSLSSDFFKKLVNLPYSFFSSRQSGDLLYRFSNLRAIRTVLSENIMKMFLDIILTLVIFTYMLYKSFTMSLILLGFILIIYCFILILRPWIHEANRHELSQDTKLFSYQNEITQGILDVKIMGHEKHSIKYWNKLYFKFIQSFIHKERVVGTMESITSSFTFFIPVFILIFGIMSINNGNLTLGEVVSFQTLSSYFVSTSTSIVYSIEAFFQMKVYLRRVKDVTDEKPEKNLETGKSITIDGEIKLENVSFKYSSFSPYILKNINMNVKKGQKVGIVGESGAGKTTLAKIIMGLYIPSDGTLQYNGIDLNQLNKPNLRNQIGVVTQNPYLFSDTIFENVKFNNPVSESQIIEACKIAQIHDDIINMPMGYNTILSENGSNLSGGQKQRLSIARAIVKKPSVIVFDEATNSLDTVKEKIIEDYLYSLNCTRIIIAHRLSSIINSDNIFVLDNGMIIGEGKHDYLINNNNKYRTLFNKIK
ncbi:peptidase domain-containing ABC transporter [Staphylococcus pasteuri]|uniref:peptidase domain-containing ABC transporter n=1 Tax=Staphylococcus pasteuri TaxID=45972 RepID=UPI002DB901C1|nr:peptidase domain-containing ABC transporter [Staphylococcus pasteuri]MEB6613503.1 peptidase domain-containing ABC transporter [Staphylococcus pasteuri]